MAGRHGRPGVRSEVVSKNLLTPAASSVRFSYMNTQDMARSVSRNLVRSTRGRLEFKPGYILALEFSATGGVSYRREATIEEQDGEGMRAELHTHKHVDHVELNKNSRAIVNQAYHIVDKYATPTPLGYWVDELALSKITTELAGAQEAAAVFNELAKTLGSARRIEISVYPLALAENNEMAARRVARDVRDRIQAIREALAAADRKGFDLAWDKAKNLDRMATGIQADSIRMALDHAKTVKTQLLEALRAGYAPVDIAAALDLEPLDAAISLFQDQDA